MRLINVTAQVAFPPLIRSGYNAGMDEEWEILEGPGSAEPYRSGCSLTIWGEPDPLTTFIVATVAIAFTAFCIWLTVHIVNRRERWAKRLGIATLMIVLLG